MISSLARFPAIAALHSSTNRDGAEKVCVKIYSVVLLIVVWTLQHKRDRDDTLQIPHDLYENHRRIGIRQAREAFPVS